MSWISDLARADHDAPFLWSTLKAALQVNVDDFEQHYGQAGRKLTLIGDNDNAVEIEIREPSNHRKVEVVFRPTPANPQVTAVFTNARPSKIAFDVQLRGGQAEFVLGADQLGVKDAARLLLEPVLFPKRPVGGPR